VLASTLLVTKCDFITGKAFALMTWTSLLDPFVLGEYLELG
jgi:hypothetical protein